ncbi:MULTISPECIES: HalOD1 output domain-containing protein [Halorussus]|uniref:HalOD1 output domain-containing protein n=1 Tax=Halorussus TaxID=1070314 RepID=UPI00209C737D|nr:HalOD1 output domain-containing protein [Halorussus vallis]USZ75128.1 hypothetical protein NGM07_17045 [Halorussus vallis]
MSVSSFQPTESEDQGLISQIVSGIADAKGVDTCDIEPLHRSIDPEALVDLFSDTVSGEERNDGMAAFTHSDCNIVVCADGSIDVFPTE